MQAQQVIDAILKMYDGIKPKASWGETSMFYNPNLALPNGIYFCTIKTQDGLNDKSSQLDRDDIYRLSIGINKASYNKLFGDKPDRPVKGGIVDTGHDFTLTDQLMPHPIYAWMSWVQIINPSESSFTELLPLLSEAHASAMLKFNRKVNK